MNIRELSDADIKEALDLVWSVFCEFEAPEYKREGVEEFKRFISFSAVNEMRASGELRIWGFYDDETLYDDGTLAGVIATRGPAHISLLFVRKEYHRRGIARSLLSVAEESCRLAGRSEITVNSSPYAVDVYHHLGFVDTDKEKVMNGIRFTPMKYSIRQ